MHWSKRTWFLISVLSSLSCVPGSAGTRARVKIRAALRDKGVSDSLVSMELEARSGEWTELAAEWLQRQHHGPIDFDGKKKLYRRLANRGFTHAQAMDAINRQ